MVAAISGEDWSHEDARPTIASGIAVSMPPRLIEMVEAIRMAAGTGVTVTEDSLKDWQKRIASSEGLFVEITSAVAFAGLAELIKSGAIQKGSNVCLPITGSGLKEPLQ